MTTKTKRETVRPSRAKTPAADSFGVLSLAMGHVWGFWNEKQNPNNMFPGLPAINPGRDDAASWGLPALQIPPDMIDEYDISQGAIIVHPIGCGLFGKGTQAAKIAAKQRQSRYEHFRKLGELTLQYAVGTTEVKGKEVTQTSITFNNVADAMESHLGTEILYGVVCGQRRFYSWPFTVALRAVLGKAGEYLFAAKEQAYVSAAETRRRQWSENADNARLGYSAAGLLRNAIVALNDDPLLTETQVGRYLGLAGHYDTEGKLTIAPKRGQQQQYDRWAHLAISKPAIKLYDRVLIDAKHDPDPNDPKKKRIRYVAGGHVPVAKLHKEDVQSLRGKGSKVTDAVTRMNLSVVQGTAATDEQVESYLAAKIGDTVAPDPCLKKEELVTYNGIPAVQEATAKVGDVLTAIVNGNRAFFGQFKASLEK